MLIQGQRLRGSDYFLTDLVLHNAETTSSRGWVFQGHYDVMPARVGGLGYIGGAWVGLRVGMAVGDADHIEAFSLGSELDLEMLLGVERIQLRTLGDVAHGNKPLNA